MREIFERTKSICPECKKELDAEIIEESGSILMEKQCDDHGFFKSLISKYSWYYKGLNHFYNLLFPNGHKLGDKTIKIFQFYPTSQCNLDCNICFNHSDIVNKQEFNLALDEIKKMVSLIKGKKRIGLLGGEPTLRDDLPEVIKIISQAGHQVWLYTNGLRFIEPRYVEKIKKSGVSYVWIWVDSLRDDDIYIKMRGEKLLDKKKQALNNLKLFNIKTGLINVVARDINESEIDDIITFARQNHFISGISIRGYSNIGRQGLSLANEFVMDELIEVIEKETRGKITLKEFFLFQKLTYIIRALFPNQPQCYMCQYLYFPRVGERKMRDIFPFEELSYYIKKFEEICQESPIKAKIFFMRFFSKTLIQNPIYSTQMMLQKMFPDQYNYYILLEVAMFYTLYNIDLRKTRTRCTDAWLPDYARGRLIDFCGLLAGASST